MAAAVLALAMAAACADDGPEIPGAPTPNTDAQRSAGDVPMAAASMPTFGPVDTASASADARSQGRYSWSTRLYRELIANDLDRNPPGARLLRDPASIRINVFRGDVDGRCSIGDTVRDQLNRSINYRSLIRGSARRLIEDATGQPWRGRVYSTARSGLAAQISNDPGYITVGFVSDPQQCGGGRAAGCAQVGSRPGGIKLRLDSSCRARVYGTSDFSNLFAHELGHSLGFFHVSDASWTMHEQAKRTGARYTGREAQHMQLGSRYAREGRGNSTGTGSTRRNQWGTGDVASASSIRAACGSIDGRDTRGDPMRLFVRALAAFGLGLGLPAAPAVAQPDVPARVPIPFAESVEADSPDEQPAGAAWTPRFFVTVNAGSLATATAFVQTRRFGPDRIPYGPSVSMAAAAAEESSFEARYSYPAELGQVSVLDVGARAGVSRYFAIGVAYSQFAARKPVAVEARVPHPFHFNRPRMVSGVAPAAQRRERALHLSAVGAVPLGAVTVSVFAGPTLFFNFDQEYVADVEFVERYPFDRPVFSRAEMYRSASDREMLVGFHGGLDVSLWFVRNAGAGVLVRFSQGQAGGETESFLGGVHALAGLRLRF